MPRHVAVILDRTEAACLDRVRELLDCCAELGVAHLTICAEGAGRQALQAGAGELEARAREKGVGLRLGPQDGRAQILAAARSIAAGVKSGRLAPASVTARLIDEHLETAGCPDPDLAICTGGQQRLSNHLLWQVAYAELYLASASGPQFGREQLIEALVSYQSRDRRFGKVAPAPAAAPALSRAV